MMVLPLKKIKETLNNVFDSSGYNFKDINIKFPQKLNISFYEDEKQNVSLNFDQDLPNITWKKFIKISAWIQGITLSDTGGTIKIKYFPDLKFSYAKDSEQLFGNQVVLDIDGIKSEINKQYPDEERKKIANTCLQYVNEWITICNAHGVGASDFLNSEKKLKRDCQKFVKSCIKEEKKHGSVIVSFIILYVVLPIILKWIIDKVFDKLNNSN